MMGMGKNVTPLKVYKLLDKSNCGDCGKESCLEFAKLLLDRKVTLDQCTHIKRPDQMKNYYAIKELVQPPQWEVSFGSGNNVCTIGGEDVLHRHERTFYNQTAIAIDVHDQMDDLKSAVTTIDKLKINRIGESLTVDAIAIRCVSGDPGLFIRCIKQVCEISNLPLIFCTFDSMVMRRAASEFQELRPLLYTATPENANDFAVIAKERNLPLVCRAKSKEKLYSLVQSLTEFGVKDLVLDPGTYFGQGNQTLTYNIVQEIRHQIFEKGVKEWGYPILGVPASIWCQVDPEKLKGFKDLEVAWTKGRLREDNPMGVKNSDMLLDYHEIQYRETLMGITLMSVDANMLIIRTGRQPRDIWSILGLLTYRQNIFTDPREYPRVEPGLAVVGDPDKSSPIYVTSNYRMTKIPVEQDLKDAELNGYLLVVDTDGIGIESATAGGQFNEEKIKDALEQTQVLDRVNHRTVILPGMAARLQEPLELLADVSVMVGPRDSSGIPKFIKKKWNIDENT